MTPETFQTVSLVANGVVVVGVPLLQLWLGERVKNDARISTEQLLANHEHRLSAQLAAISAEHQRRVQEQGLFAQRKHAAYAKLFGQYRRAMNAFQQMTGLSFSPGFKDYGQEAIERYAEQNDILLSDMATALKYLGQGDDQRKADELYRVHTRLQQRTAEREFNRAKYFESIYELYLSADVRSAVESVRGAMAKVSVAILNEVRGSQHLLGGKDSYEHGEDMAVAVAKLREVMRAELQRGDEPVLSA